MLAQGREGNKESDDIRRAVDGIGREKAASRFCGGGFFADGLSGFGVRRFVFLFGAVSGAGFVERHFIIG